MSEYIEKAVYVGGVLHFVILLASALTPRVLGWQEHLAALPAMLRQLFWVYGVFIVITIISFGVLSILHADAMGEGLPVARSLSLVIAIFWALRLGVQFFIFDIKPFLTNWGYKLGYHCLTFAFTSLVVIYSYAFIAPNI